MSGMQKYEAVTKSLVLMFEQNGIPLSKEQEQTLHGAMDAMLMSIETIGLEQVLVNMRKTVTYEKHRRLQR